MLHVYVYQDIAFKPIQKYLLQRKNKVLRK